MEDKKIKTIIVDDEHLARSLIADYVSKVPYLELLGTFKNAIEAMAFLQSHTIDLMFLDIQMPNLSGIEFVESMGSNKPMIVFTTAYSEYAIKGFELNAFDYLLKPVTFPRFLQTINKVGKQFELLTTSKGEVQHSLPVQNINTKNGSITIKADYKLYRIKFEDLLYMEGQKEYVAFHTSQKSILTLTSLKKLENDLPSEKFIRIHKSYIVNINAIETLEGNILGVNGVELPVGLSYRADLLKIFE
ncbi:LytR/AlgR family response regulator transcription factor [Flammeovirga kamogawensis]|uniref:LytTR family DNA-binding domain-containing protein n=1 Tax=Flammeovirga kamogawensis TaxID=373891 RepID=A0ABX8GYR8_9BACT|nr:LytTR family DNA-binding domain-containing protein [Flammeovirga kamogawensis]MBB6462881.1 DNA-binding LytR/AlgR family response regulator [Flammeovirga kamogawensis]QWG08337.1 LytTR family DNA-binding domain-containing protein [Flammeovirga kamogawensis]TRX66634.1 response regulator transcription factor [Flammeovirga kamogawensis]